MKYLADSDGKRGVIEIYTHIPLGQSDMQAVKVEWDSSASPKYLNYYQMVLTGGATDWSTMFTGDYASWFEAYIDGNVAEVNGAWHCRECDGGNDIKEYFQAFRSETHELMGGTSCDPANTCVTPKNYECREIAGNPPATETDGVNYSDANTGSCAGFNSGGYTMTPIQPTQASLDLFGDVGSIWTLNQ